MSQSFINDRLADDADDDLAPASDHDVFMAASDARLAMYAAKAQARKNIAAALAELAR